MHPVFYPTSAADIRGKRIHILTAVRTAFAFGIVKYCLSSSLCMLDDKCKR